MEIAVATDLWGRKCNLRLRFKGPIVTLAELRSRAESVFQYEAVASRPPSVRETEVPVFTVTAMTILVDRKESKWVDLVSPKQLSRGCQVFVFQPPHPLHSDSRDLIPEPCSPLLLTHGKGRTVPSPVERHSPPVRCMSASAGRSAASPQSPRSGRSSPRADNTSPLARARMSPLNANAQRMAFLDRAHETFEALAVDGRIRVAEIKAALVLSVGNKPGDLRNMDELLRVDGRTTWSFAQWAAFCEAQPTALSILAGRVDVARSPKHNQRPSSDGSRMSPPRARQSKLRHQQTIVERLHGGLASVVTAKDRARGDYSHAVNMLPSSPRPSIVAPATRQASA